jgi:hypothetical protein
MVGIVHCVVKYVVICYYYFCFMLYIDNNLLASMSYFYYLTKTSLKTLNRIICVLYVDFCLLQLGTPPILLLLLLPAAHRN